MRLTRSSTVEKSIQSLLRLVLKGGDRQQGFTLIELLVAMIVGSLIVSGLLYGVVEILQTNQKDGSRSDTQRDMQMALDYIARDVREATYVYGVTQATDPADPTRLLPKESCLATYADFDTRGKAGKCTGLLNVLPENLSKNPIKTKDTQGNTPVLAFWKPEPLPANVRSECKSKAAQVGTGNPALDRIPCVAQRMYTLVIYSINTEPATGFQWKGRARITRYQLPHFTEGSPIKITDGWGAPVAKDKRPLTWPIGDTATAVGQNLQESGPITAADTRSNVVLADFVDNDPVPYDPKYCPAGFDAPSGFGSSNSFNQAFYVCVRSGAVTAATGSGSAIGLATEAAAAAGQGLNPEVHIVLRGNAAGRGGIPLLGGDLPFQMETRVLSRGVYGKLSN